MIYQRLSRFRSLMLAAVILCMSGPAWSSDALDSAKQEPESQTTQEPATTENVMKDLGGAYTAVKRYTYLKKKDFETWGAAQISELEPKIESYEQRLKEARSDLRDKWTTEIVPTLQKKKLEAQEKFQELKTSSAAAWPHLKWGFIGALESLQDSFELAANEFQEKDKKNGEENGAASAK